MCWAYRTVDGGIVAKNEEIFTPHLGRITRSGKESAVLTMQDGEPSWIALRYGMMFPASGGGTRLIWNARDDKLKTVEAWFSMIRRRFAVPVDAYVENAPEETWHIGQTAWMVGLYDQKPGGGSVVITEQGGNERIPILVGKDAAARWLAAEQWAAIPGLAREKRIAYREADVFEAKMLEIDARTRVPLDKAA